MALNDAVTPGPAKAPTLLGRPAVRYLDRAAVELATIKRDLREMLALRPGHRVLDVGCGTGMDILDIAAHVGPGGRAAGVDISEHTIEEARLRAAEGGLPADFTVAGVEELPFPAAAFDATRAERVLQHVAEPVQAVSEMLRVTRPGGRVLVADPDHGMWAPVLTDRDLTRTLLSWWFDHVRNPWMGRELAGVFRAAGASDVRVKVEPIVLADLDAADALTGLVGAVQIAAEQGVITAGQAESLREEMSRRDAEGRFLMCGAMVAVLGRKDAR